MACNKTDPRRRSYLNFITVQFAGVCGGNVFLYSDIHPNNLSAVKIISNANFSQFAQCFSSSVCLLARWDLMGPICTGRECRVDWDRTRILEIESSITYRKCQVSARCDALNQSYQSKLFLDISTIWIPLISLRVIRWMLHMGTGVFKAPCLFVCIGTNSVSALSAYFLFPHLSTIYLLSSIFALAKIYNLRRTNLKLQNLLTNQLIN